MRKIHALVLPFIFLSGISNIVLSQDIQSLTIIRDSLVNVKNDLNRQLTDVSYELKSVDEKIAIIQLDSIKKTAITAYTSETLSGKLREGTMASSELITMIPFDSEIKIVGYSDAYFKVIYKNQIGYLSEIFVPTTEELENYKKLFSYSEKKINTSSPKGTYTIPASSKTKSYTPKTSKTYYKGPRGGCYYISSSGKKVYVDRSLCN